MAAPLLRSTLDVSLAEVKALSAAAGKLGVLGITLISGTAGFFGFFGGTGIKLGPIFEYTPCDAVPAAVWNGSLCRVIKRGE